LSVFTGPRPVIYIPIVKSPTLIDLHTRLWQITHTHAPTLDQLYAPAHWMPHITLAVEDITLAQLPELLADLTYRSFTWEIPLDQLTVFEQVQTTWTPARELPLLPPPDRLLETTP
jgi:2'-5' RNA ligase